MLWTQQCPVNDEVDSVGGDLKYSTGFQSPDRVPSFFFFTKKDFRDGSDLGSIPILHMSMLRSGKTICGLNPRSAHKLKEKLRPEFWCLRRTVQLPFPHGTLESKMHIKLRTP